MSEGKKDQKWSVRLLAIMTACAVTIFALTGCSPSSGNSSEESTVSIEQETQAGQEAQLEQETQAGQEAQPEQQTPAEQEIQPEQQAPAGQETQSDPPTAAEEQVSQTASTEPLTLQVLKVGKADAMVLMCGDSTMVIDCGEEEDGEDVLEYLAQKGVEKIDILMITHFDKDHVGGADTVVEKMPVERVLMPDYEGSGKKYKSFLNAAEEAGIEPERVAEVLSLQLGSAAVTIEPPASYEIPDSDEEYDNNFSLITTVELGSNRLVFTGDIEEERISQWLESGNVQKCDVVKIPHHGFYNEPLEKMVDIMQPSYAIICDSEKNPAEKETVSMLEEKGAQCLQTKNGDITIVCDGENIEASQ